MRSARRAWPRSIARRLVKSRKAWPPLARTTGRGPTKARTTIGENGVFVVLQDSLTVGEQTLADHGEGHAGVATRRVEHDATATQPAFLLRVEHHPERGPVLDAPAGVRTLDLYPEVAAQSRADAVQRDERRVANAFEDRSAHALANKVGGETGQGPGPARPGLSPAPFARGGALRRNRRSPRRRATSDRR